MAIPFPGSLVRHLREGRCALFVGAGVSAAAGLPGWTKLLELMVREVEAEDPVGSTGAELRQLLATGKLLEVADHCRDCLGGRRYLELLQQELRGGTGKLPDVHRVITQLPFSAVVTTNYDKLLERSYTQFRGELPKVVTGRNRENLGSLLFSGGFFILKAHGDIDDASSLVLTSRDYRDIIHANAAFNALFSALLMTRSVLFVGYSLGDPDFRLLLEGQLAAFGDNIPERYAVMAGVGAVESAVLKRTANIKVLPYAAEQHDEVLAFLRSLVARLAEAPSTTPTTAATPTGSQSLSLTRSAVAHSAPTIRVEATSAVLRQAAADSSSNTLMPVSSGAAALYLGLRDGRLEVVLRTDQQEIVHLVDPGLWSILTKRLPGMLERLTRSSSDEVTHAFGVQLGALLPAKEIHELGSAPLTLIPTPDVADIPWELAICGGVDPIAIAQPVCRALLDGAAVRGLPGVRRPTNVLIVGDPGRTPAVRLPGAHEEALAIDGVYRASNLPGTTTCLFRELATLDTFVDALSDAHYDCVHFAGHAWFDRQESYLEFDAGEYITATELRSLLGPRPPAILILNSHYTAFIPRGITPGGARENADSAPPLPAPSQVGFMSMVESTGIGAFIGCFASPSDQAAKQFGVALHQSLVEGSTIGVAAHLARRTTYARSDRFSALQYVLSGHPGYRISTTERSSTAGAELGDRDELKGARRRR